jgi:serine/threonine protein phosphatase PrpC
MKLNKLLASFGKYDYIDYLNKRTRHDLPSIIYYIVKDHVDKNYSAATSDRSFQTSEFPKVPDESSGKKPGSSLLKAPPGAAQSGQAQTAPTGHEKPDQRAPAAVQQPSSPNAADKAAQQPSPPAPQETKGVPGAPEASGQMPSIQFQPTIPTQIPPAQPKPEAVQPPAQPKPEAVQPPAQPKPVEAHEQWPPDVESIASPDTPAVRLTLLLKDPKSLAGNVEVEEQIKYMDSQIKPLLFKINQPAEISIRLTTFFTYGGNVATNKFMEDLGFTACWKDGRILISSHKPKSFDGKLVILYCIGNYTNGSGRKKIKVEKEFYVPADPRTLWKDFRVEDYEGYHSPDADQNCQKIPQLGKILTAASCRGRSHAHVGKPRDDNFRFKADPVSGWTLMAVADGAGSARFSRKGSEIACESAVDGLLALLGNDNIMDLFTQKHEMMLEWKKLSDSSSLDEERETFFRKTLNIDPIVYKVIYETYVKIVEEAQRKKAEMGSEKISVRDYYTTLLVMAIKKFDFGYFYVSFWIGDGGMAILNDGIRPARVLGEPDSGDYAGQTRFLTMVEEITEEKIRRRTRCGFAKDFEAVILATDGVTDPYFPSEADVLSPEHWLKFWNKTLRAGEGDNPGCPEVYDRRALPEDRALALRRWLDFWSKGNHDDRTIMILN